MTGQLAKQRLKAAANAESGRAAAREAREQAAEQRFPAPEPSRTATARKPASKRRTNGKAVAAAKRKRHNRAKHAADAPDDEGSQQSKKQRKQAAVRREQAAKALGLPKDIGATAASRHATFGGSADSARQKAEYHVREAAKHIEKLVDKGEAAKVPQACARLALGAMER
jgi:hypothetical protein